MRFDHLRHTPEQLSAQLGSMQENAQRRVIGSLGRSVYYLAAFSDPFSEIATMTGDHPLQKPNGEVRDIDTFELEHPNTTLGSFPVDEWNNARSALRCTSNGQWYLEASRLGFREPVHPDTVAPCRLPGVYGLEITTVPIHTLYWLHKVKGVPRDKDMHTFTWLKSALTCLGDDTNNDIYDPFKQLHELWRERIQKMPRLYRPYLQHKTVDNRFIGGKKDYRKTS